MELFLFELTINDESRSYRSYHHTVMKLTLPGEVPNMLLSSKHSGHGFREPRIVDDFPITNTLSLEGNFNQRFSLYASDDNTIEALEVFSPDTMAILEDDPERFVIEFVHDRIYIYSKGYISKSKDLIQLFTLTKQLASKVGPVSSRLSDSVAQSQPSVSPSHLGLRRALLVVLLSLAAVFVAQFIVIAILLAVHLLH